MNFEVVVIVFMGLSIVVLVAQPLVMRAALVCPPDAAAQNLERLSVQKETLYTAIYDLDFDFQTGKVDREDYAALRHRLEAEAIQILRQIDQADPLAELDSELERQILALRQPSPQQTLPSIATKACRSCSITLYGNENFCPACGHPQGQS